MNKSEKLEHAKYKLEEIGIDITFECESRIEFEFKGNTIMYYPLKEWATGKGIEDGRGLDNLLKQIGCNWESLENSGLDNKLTKW